MRRVLPLKSVFPILVMMSALVSACGGQSSDAIGPTAPGAGGAASQGSPPGMGTMGNMPGLGMAMLASEFDYLAQMIPHHDEAIATATLLQRGTELPEMRAFGASIVATQSAEVEQMKAWLAGWYPGRDTRVEYTPMMRDLAGLSGSALDRAFLEDMIPHHMMAVMMSQQLVVRGLATHPDVVPFARNIRDTQQQEIRMMSDWLRDWFGATVGMGGRH